MLTLFSTCKPFHGHNGVIQRNALKSWSLLHPDIEIILFGDDAGVADVSRELGIRHEPHTEKNEFGLKRLDYMFSRAQKISRHDLLCYINCDIILMNDFCRTLERANAAHAEFLMVGRRWDTDIFETIDFSTPDWAAEIRRRALAQNCQRDAWYIDYFCFSRGLFGPDMPRLVVGRVYWDNWTIWKALDSKKAVVDASRAILAIHQNHEYQYHPRGKEGVWSDEQAQRNFVLAGGFAHLRSIDSAQFRFTDMGIEHNPFHWYAHWSTTMDRRVRPARTFFRSRVWYPLLDLTRPVRHLVGLKRGKPIKRREQC
jgi:hypothetical protein